ncbi:MAG: DNA mismatch repair protein MutT [Flammeovirgaceae bacterium]|nr:DNA mismatch repair protein MutT [Flammeovirgaceae bacterium]MBE62622.1 DNA mismatch repair protein MutT [Flammeovirgaceae bacterium]MBR07214.1 DNA mismatch repair protein MutT [Rickettsiales bacterium]HCX22758.1 DNA mismatch repair protein MutT [Cytophagales bacterium]|tara:strand:+ start:2175 stop:2867 length:693 start_codon:yes stop_codon:yes gene_type:complete
MTYNHPKILVAIDCLVFGYDTAENDLKVLLFQREVEPFAGEWSLIGGFVNEDENLSDGAERVLEKFTGLKDVFLEQLSTYGKANRDPGGRVVSILYWSLIKLDELHRDIANEHGARWFDLDELPKLVLDHEDMVRLGEEKLVQNAKSRPIGFELLPEDFTLPQLKQLYDAIYGKSIDDRNFRKKILSTDLLIKTDKKDKSTSKKGAFVYQFDAEKYNDLRKQGYHLDLNV